MTLEMFAKAFLTGTAMLGGAVLVGVWIYGFYKLIERFLEGK